MLIVRKVSLLHTCYYGVNVICAAMNDVVDTADFSFAYDASSINLIVNYFMALSWMIGVSV